MRRLRERRRRGVVAVVPVEVVDSDLTPLMAARLLTQERAADTAALQAALEAVIEDWMDAHASDA